MSSQPGQSSDQAAQSPPPAAPAAQDAATERTVDQPSAAIIGTTKADAGFLEAFIDLVAKDLEMEKNEVRRQNAQACLEFVTRHGYPADGYEFTAHIGIVEVFTRQSHYGDHEHEKRVGPWPDTYGLVSCCPLPRYQRC